MAFFVSPTALFVVDLTKIQKLTADCVKGALQNGIDEFPWWAWPRDAAATRTGKQAGKALRSQGHHYARVM